eukprot:CAMPEP_0202956196 /NCGR_PEP_ID=MMETSP1396-20130829/735_1 /ASSEMBLY_ACC=CAM_ASM_000872 /TAXON_ID= /ORGANISM="Pseudokeronopsis sp., Strain Brazil" /LENGTH=74 /DNA_ID=CAMNT_0049673113 /DNA_START=466 /DNA_END=690 /DNA_ORIENTATION=+
MKVGGYYILGMKDDFYFEGKEPYYKDAVDKLVKEGKYAFVSRTYSKLDVSEEEREKIPIEMRAASFILLQKLAD